MDLVAWAAPCGEAHPGRRTAGGKRRSLLGSKAVQLCGDAHASGVLRLLDVMSLLAIRKTSSIIFSVSLPVFVFCKDGCDEQSKMRPSGRDYRAPWLKLNPAFDAITLRRL